MGKVRRKMYKKYKTYEIKRIVHIRKKLNTSENWSLLYDNVPFIPLRLFHNFGQTSDSSNLLYSASSPNPPYFDSAPANFFSFFKINLFKRTVFWSSTSDSSKRNTWNYWNFSLRNLKNSFLIYVIQLCDSSSYLICTFLFLCFYVWIFLYLTFYLNVNF